MYNILSFVTLDFRYTGKISSGVKVHNDNDRSRKCASVSCKSVSWRNIRLTETRSLEDKIDEPLALRKTQARDFDSFHEDKDAISVKSWLELSNSPKTQSRYKQRRQLLGYWAIANGRTIERVLVRVTKR